jgi:hypothetical protein
MKYSSSIYVFDYGVCDVKDSMESNDYTNVFVKLYLKNINRKSSGTVWK